MKSLKNNGITRLVTDAFNLINEPVPPDPELLKQAIQSSALRLTDAYFSLRIDTIVRSGDHGFFKVVDIDPRLTVSEDCQKFTLKPWAKGVRLNRDGSFGELVVSLHGSWVVRH